MKRAFWRVVTVEVTVVVAEADLVDVCVVDGDVCLQSLRVPSPLVSIARFRLAIVALHAPP